MFRQHSKYPISGVYAIKNELNKRVYIGRSVDIKARWEEHKILLNNNTHHSLELQNDWNIYPKGCFKFQILEKCSVDDSKYKEVYYFFQFENIYNNISSRHKLIYKIGNYLDSLQLKDLKYKYCYHTSYQKCKIPWDLFIKYKNEIVILFQANKDDFWELRTKYLELHNNTIFIHNKITDSNIEYIFDKFKTNIDLIINM